MSDYLDHADVFTVLDLIAAEFRTDPTSVQCFDLRLVERAKVLAAENRHLAHKQPLAGVAQDRLWCMNCGKSVSTEVPKGTIVRAWAQCPECMEAWYTQVVARTVQAVQALDSYRPAIGAQQQLFAAIKNAIEGGGSAVDQNSTRQAPG